MRSAPEGPRESSARSFNDLANLLTVVRWGTLIVSVFLSASKAQLDRHQVAYATILVAYSLFRTLKPLRYGRKVSGLFASISFELALTTTIVIVTGLWSSPFAGTLLLPVIAGGFA